MKLLEGKKVSEGILENLQAKIAAENIRPCLAVVLVGDDPASHLYVRLKEKAAAQVGIEIKKIVLSETVSQEEVVKTVKTLNDDKGVDGILVQLPLPEKFHMQEVIDALDPAKDIDGFHPENERLFVEGKALWDPVFPRAIFELIRSAGVSLSGKQAVVVGNSEIFGHMMLAMLSRFGIEGEFIRQNFVRCREASLMAADVVVSAVGVPGIITGKMLKPGAIVIDGGIAQLRDKVVGDVDKESVEHKDIFLSPVPGGVGPVTVACLLENVYWAVKKKED